MRIVLPVLALAVLLSDIGVVVTRLSSSSSPKQHTYQGPVVTDTAGHFAARFPATPLEIDPPTSGLFGVSFALHLAVTHTPILTEVEAIDFPRPALTGPIEELRSSITGFANSSGFTLVSQGESHFRGHEALVASLRKPDHSSFSLLVVKYDDRTAYLLAADAPYFAELASSFRPLTGGPTGSAPGAATSI
jgi:hypothetical protein